ncbi:MAG: ABC transporter ATP-binding protein [Deltaproteobacteria bacterium RBG_13_52_11]|nr:MAG: ABC transporter ATP-binding protein [Deltaproteobacteria bacterium RBG_13_52_11]
MLLEIKNLWIRYEGAEVLKGISCSIEEGTIVTFLGSNGAGKSTTLRAICGLKAPDSGEIWFNGERIDGNSPQNIIKQGIGHVLEGRALFPYMTVLENLKVGAFLQKDREQIDRNLGKIFANFPILKERQQQQARTLSGGEQQMLAIARALMGSPKLLLLDEPSLGLSPLMVREIGTIVQEIHQRGVSVLLVEQNARLALGVAQRCYVFETGSVALSGETKEMLGTDQVRKAYLGL